MARVRGMLLVYPSILLPPPDCSTGSDVRTIVGIPAQAGTWPSASLEPGACNDFNATVQAITAVSDDVERIVPLTEKVMLACAFVSQERDLRHSLGIAAALNCTDRRRQRMALEGTGLNPRWYVDGLGDLQFPIVVKKPASARSAGVRVVRHLDELQDFLNGDSAAAHEQRLHASGHTPAYSFIAEQFIDGESWEVSGISREHCVHVFPPLKQIWTAPNERIVEYRVEPAPRGLIEAATNAAARCGVTWSSWCVELKGQDGVWKVIEVNGRLGEDGKRYYELLGGVAIANTICELLA